MSKLYIYDDAQARTFEPFALTRPVGELRAGAALMRERWEGALGVSASGSLVAPHLGAFDEEGAPPAHFGPVPAGSIVANSRCAAPLLWSAPDADAWTCQGRIAAVRTSQEIPASILATGDVSLDTLSGAGARTADVPGRWLDEVWQLVTDLTAQLQDDITSLGPTLERATAEGAIIIGSHPVYLERGAMVEPQVCFDVAAGPVLVRSGATVRAFTRLVGPCAVLSGATVVGDRVHGCSIGEGSVVRGEISETVVLGNANKGHDGFVGHSYLGRWVNLGAGTITSNLKNTYGTVSLWTPRGTRDTGVLKLGTLFGDHVKTGIGMRLTTGSLIGAGSNIYGSAIPPKFVPPFSWGENGVLEMYRIDKFLAVAERAMARRNVPLTPGAMRLLRAAHERGRS